MIDNISATIPVTSRFGWPKPARVEEFKKLLASPSGATFRIVFQGKIIDIPIIRVSIDLPKYRMANGRTSSLQAEYLARHPTAQDDLFSGDAELWDSQEVQHGLLLKVARQSDLRKYFEDTSNQQVEPLLLDENGFVVNGNRRLSTWRDLCHTEKAKYSHFLHIDVAVLPHCDEKEIDRLEATLQIEKDIKADYSWDAEANMMIAKQKRDGFSNKDLAELYGMKDADVVSLIDMRSYADEYLRSRGKTDIWSEVAHHEEAFRKISTSRQRISGIGSQEVFKQAAFALIDNPDEAGGRLYDTIPAIVESLDQIKEKLQAEFELKPDSKVSALQDLFGGSPASDNTTSLDIPLAKEMQKPECADRARKIIVEVIESQRQLKKDSKSASYLLDCCAKAQSMLAAAVKDGLRPESKLPGVAKQLDQIQLQLETIRTYLAEHA